MNIEEKAPNNRESRNVEHDTKINRKSKPGFDSILPKLNLYTREAAPHVISASRVSKYPNNSSINLRLLNIVLILF